MSVGNSRHLRLRTTLWYLILGTVALSMLMPLLWMVSTSLKRPEVSERDFLPGNPTVDNYVNTVKKLPFARFYINSALVAVTVTFGQVLTSALAAYAFARLNFPGRNKIFLAYLATMMVPQAVTMVPLFVLLTKAPIYLDLLFRTEYFGSEVFFLGKWFAGVPVGIDSYFVLIAPALFSAYGTFLLRQFFLGIPRELEEAAEIDGCSLFQIFRRIIIPLSKPALATLAAFTFMNNWRSFMWPLIMTNSLELRTLPVGLASFLGMYQTEWPLLMAGSMMMLGPMIIVFVVCQRWFVSGIQLGAVKG